MSAIRASVVLLCLAAQPAGASAALGPPGFSLDFCAWVATHIVVVTEGEKIDGNVDVLESWKGDLKKGDRLTLPELAAFAPEKARAVSKSATRPAEKLPAAVTCSRVVLFLVRKVEKVEGQPDKTTWLPAAHGLLSGGMKTSAAWVEADKVFTFDQGEYEGNPWLQPWDGDERLFKQKVDWVLGVQTAITEAVRLDDPAKITAALPPLLRPESDFVSAMVIRTLGEAGPKCLPALRSVLKDDKKLRLHTSLLGALVAAGGDAAGPDLTDVLKLELAVWKKAGPGLQPGWSDGKGIGWGEALRLRDNYNRTTYALHLLAKIRHPGCRDVVIELRDLWRPLPTGGWKRPDELCDAVLEKLGRP